MEDVAEITQVKRFKHQSYNQSLKEVHPPSAFNQTQYDQEIEDHDSHFHNALDHWRQLNLSPGFIQFANKADGLSASMPLLLHNWREILDMWIEAMESSDDEGLRALLDLLQKMAHDLRTTLSPAYPDLLGRLLKQLTRSISAPALTALLETFSSLFRFLLVPSIHLNLLEDTYTAIAGTLPKCFPEIQRAMAELWGSILRRLKTAAREKAVILLASNAEGLEDASAWTIVSACKSVSQSLHTAAGSIIIPLLAYHLSAENPTVTSVILRRSLTALIHHVKNAGQFTIIGDIIIRQFSTILKSTDRSSPDDIERLRRILEVISVYTGVRQGSRVTAPQKLILSAELASLPIESPLHAALLKFTTAILVGSDMSMWLGPGLKFLQHTWGVDVSFALKLNGCLAELGWGGWKIAALPMVLKSTMRSDLLETEARKIFAFLAELRRLKKLDVTDVDMVWKTKLEKRAAERLTAWKQEDGDNAAAELNDILTLSIFFSPAMSPILIDIINRTLESSDSATGAPEVSLSNSPWVLGICMRTLAKRPTSEWADELDLSEWTKKCVAKWACSQDVLAGVVALSNASSSASAAIPVEEIYEDLQDALLSHSWSVRLNALRLLDSDLVLTDDGPEEVLKRCLQGEEVSLDMQGVRERVLRIGRVVQVVGDETGADLCARWLLAQLKVNLRPLWSPAATALASLAQRFGDIVWRLIFSNIQTLESGRQPDSTPSHWKEQEQDSNQDSPEDPWEEERTWRDPSAHKIRGVTVRWEEPEFTNKHVVEAQKSQDRLDLQSYELQLLSALGECALLAEKHNRELVPHFLSLNGADTTKLPKQKLIAWLTLFSKFSNPKALYSTDTLKNIHIALLSHPDRSVQTAALSCLFTYKSPHLSPHEEKIRIIMDDTRWRDELISLDIGNLEPQERQEVVDVIIRVLFGMMLEKKGRGRGGDRRAAVLTALGSCTEIELGLLVELMLRPLVSFSASSPLASYDLNSDVTDKQLTGYLTLLEAVLKNLGSRLASYWSHLLGTTIAVVDNVQKRIDSAMSGVDDDEEEPLGDVEEVVQMESSSSSKIIRSIRQLGLKRFADFFRCAVIFDYAPFMTKAFTSFISPRLGSLDKENTQAPSALLEIFHVWTLNDTHIRFLVDYNRDTLPRIYDCLVATNVKPSVISRIFDIVEHILGYSADSNDICEDVLKPYVSLLLANIATLVERTKGVTAIATPLAQRQIRILSEIAQYSTDSAQASTLLDLFAPLLRKPSKFVSEKIKTNMIKIIGDLISLIPDLRDQDAPVYQKTYALLSQLFQSLRSRNARIGLITTMHRFASIDQSLGALANLMENMNAYSAKRMDEPDFDRRLSAFANLNENLYASLPTSHWLPILYNSLHFIQDPVELAVRNNASFAMRRFIDFVASSSEPVYQEIFLRVLFPGLKNGLRSKNEMVRTEVLGVIAYAVEKCDNLDALREMKVLLEGGDEEANFFNNILHIQIHRRSRALRRLAEHCDEGHLRSCTLVDLYIPLVGNYIGATTSIDHHLVNDAILATGRMARHITWGAYYALVQKYLKLSRAKDESERVYVRTLVALLENFHFAMEEPVVEAEVEEENTEEADMDEDGMAEVRDPPQVNIRPTTNTAKIADAVSSRLLPNLLNHLEKHDSTTDDNTRIPIAVGIVTVAKHLPSTTREPQITRLLTILSQILRSKSQETRDLTRDALNRIAVSLGTAYLPLILRELRGALLRGPQLHVLAYMAHSLLVHITSGDHASQFETLDECANDIAYVSAEVIFGESGKDVEAEGFKTKMREVRSSASKGLDSFQIIAKFVTPLRISSLLVPLRAIMQETESLKMMQLVEEVLKRIAVGLNGNKHLTPAELLVLCHTLIGQNARFLKQSAYRQKTTPKGDAIVQMKRQTASDTDHYANNSFRFVAFGLDLLNTALRRNSFDFRDSNIISRLESMVVVVGNTLYSTSAPVLVLGLKCAAGLAKCPLKNLDNSLPVFMRQSLDIIRQAGNTESEVVQVALKSLAVILRDRPSAQAKEKDLVFLLELLAPDLEEPSRQASVFAILRAIVARKFVVPEIYDIMEKVSEIMVTSQTAQVQELCRGVLLQFLLDYPQGKGRLRNQMAFFVKNLSYVYESGRKSVLELLGAVISKFQEDLIREYADLLFVGLVMVVANDDSAKCREMAAELIKNLYNRLDEPRRNAILSHLHSWASQEARPQLVWVSSQVYGFIIDVAQTAAGSYVSSIVTDLQASLARSAEAVLAKEAQEEEDLSMEVDPEWQIPYYSLTVLSKILRVFPDLAKQDNQISWDLVVTHLLFPHAWVRMASCRLLGQLFAAVPVGLPREDLLDTHPRTMTGMQEVARRLSQQLKSEHLDEALGLQVVKNLFYLGKCFYLVAVPEVKSLSAEEEAEDLLNDVVNVIQDKEKEKPKGLNPLPWLFSKLSYQIKSAHIARRSKSSSRPNWSQQPMAALRWFAAMTSHMDGARLELFLVHILTPLYRLTQDDTIRDAQMEELKMTAIELQELVQAKVGTTKFSNVYNQIRQSALGVQRERKAARVVQATTNPEAAAKRKMHKNVIKKDSRKRKERGFADAKGKIKRRREE